MDATKTKDYVNIVLGVMVIIALLFTVGYRMWQGYESTHETWRVKSVNYGFAIVTSGETDVLARNPVGELKEGDVIILKGYGYTELPYIYAKQ